MISLDWEEGIFTGLYKFWKKTQNKPINPGRVELEEINIRLQTVAQLITGRPLVISPAEEVGGIRGQVILLPAGMEVRETPAENLTMYLVRVVLNATMIDLWGESPPDTRGLTGRVRYLFSVDRARQHVFHHFPNFASMYTHALNWELEQRPKPQDLQGTAAALETLRQDLARGVPRDEQEAIHQFSRLRDSGQLPAGMYIWGETLTASEFRTAELSAPSDQDQSPVKDGSELACKPRDHVSLTALEKTDEIAPLPMHTFEKTETLDTFKGGMRQVDGSDELEEHAEALRELDLREVIRGGRETQGFYKAELDLGEAVPDVHNILPGEKAITYPEWHFKKKKYQPDWVNVYPTPVTRTEPQLAQSIISAHRGRIMRLSQRLQAHREKNLLFQRQNQGDELDLDAVVNAYGDRIAGLDPGENLYVSQRKALRDSAITLLFDISLSSGSWVDGRRILDLTRETILILGEVGHRLGDTFRILAFASNTRNHCRAWDIKPWADSWQLARGRVCGLEPQGYTRIGPAIRHAHAGFQGIQSRRKVLLLITDGKPNDYDRYEGKHGREDIHMAIREGREQGIHTHALALDPRARRTLPAMFGTSGWQIIKRPADLTDAVVAAYGHLHG